LMIWLATSSIVQTLSCGSTRRPIAALNPYILSELAFELARAIEHQRPRAAALRRAIVGERRVDVRFACKRRSALLNSVRRRRLRRRRSRLVLRPAFSEVSVAVERQIWRQTAPSSVALPASTTAAAKAFTVRFISLS
jgi:hypothetical protein